MPLIREKAGGTGFSVLDESQSLRPADLAAAVQDLGTALREVVLLSGSVRSDRFHTGIGRSVLDLPLDTNHTLLDHWTRQLADLAGAMERPVLPVRIMLDAASPRPNVPDTDGRVEFLIERDPRDYRGTGGILRDLADANYSETDYILVANGAQRIAGPLAEHVQRLASIGGDVAIVAHRDGTPSGLMLLNCRVLRLISRTGFVDMKEQGLPVIARTHEVRVSQYDTPSGQPVRTLPDYLMALRMHHRRQNDHSLESDPFAEELRPTFRIAETGSRVEDEALLHDSVVLRGATVETGAVVVRSLIGPGARVHRGERVVDRVITGAAANRRIGEEPE